MRYRLIILNNKDERTWIVFVNADANKRDDYVLVVELYICNHMIYNTHRERQICSNIIILDENRMEKNGEK